MAEEQHGQTQTATLESAGKEDGTYEAGSPDVTKAGLRETGAVTEKTAEVAPEEKKPAGEEYDVTAAEQQGTDTSAGELSQADQQESDPAVGKPDQTGQRKKAEEQVPDTDPPETGSGEETASADSSAGENGSSGTTESDADELPEESNPVSAGAKASAFNADINDQNKVQTFFSIIEVGPDIDFDRGGSWRGYGYGYRNKGMVPIPSYQIDGSKSSFDAPSFNEVAKALNYTPTRGYVFIGIAYQDGGQYGNGYGDALPYYVMDTNAFLDAREEGGFVQGTDNSISIPLGYFSMDYFDRGWGYIHNLDVRNKTSVTIYYVLQQQTFTVTYKDGADGAVFKDQSTSNINRRGATPAFQGENGENKPVRSGFLFAGWTPEVAQNVTQDAVYTATWIEDQNENGEDDEGEQKYTVTYTDGVEGEEVFADRTYTALSGIQTPVFEGTPSRKGYVFDGWNPTVAQTVTENATYTAVWKEDKNENGTADENETYTVTYTDGVEGEEVFADRTYTALSGIQTPVFEGGEPVREGYVFAGWSPTVAETVTDNAVYTAQWKKSEIPAQPGESKELETPGKSNESGKPAVQEKTEAADQPAEAEKKEDTVTHTDNSGQSAPATASDSDMKTDTAGGSPKTGDSSNLTIWFVLMILSAAGVLSLTVNGRRKRDMQ